MHPHWMPVNLMSISTQFMDRYPIEMVAWIMVLFGSINSVTYPLLFFHIKGANNIHKHEF